MERIVWRVKLEHIQVGEDKCTEKFGGKLGLSKWNFVHCSLPVLSTREINLISNFCLSKKYGGLLWLGCSGKKWCYCFRDIPNILIDGALSLEYNTFLPFENRLKNKKVIQVFIPWNLWKFQPTLNWRFWISFARAELKPVLRWTRNLCFANGSPSGEATREFIELNTGQQMMK